LNPDRFKFYSIVNKKSINYNSTKGIIQIAGFIFLIFISFSAFAQPEKTDRVSLDGTWQIVFDNENLGRNEGWQKDSVFQKQNIRNINVPSCWELIEKDYEGVAFYRKEFSVPASWKGKIIRLQFGAVNYLAEVWLNDEVVGYHEGGFTPFEFRVDEMIKPGETNVLTLRVVGPIILSDKEIDGVKALETPQWRGGITGGIWQSVSLVATGNVLIDDVFIEPKIGNNTASFHLELDNTAIKGSSAGLKIDVFEVGGNTTPVASQVQIVNLHPGKNKQSYTLEIPGAKYWSPKNPHLYRANVSVLNTGEVSDKWSSNFGMRELTIKNKDFYLNGERIYIKATFFEGLYPNGIANPDNEEMARREIRLAKEAGFNMIRPWRRPPALMWLDLADEMGVLVVGSPVLECMGLPLSTPYLPARVENEITQSILRDRNRACVVQWELFNELHRPILKQMMRPMAMLARGLDPTRLILDESGGWAFGANMYLPYDFEPTPFNDIHDYPGPFISNSYYDGYLSIGMTDGEKKDAGLTARTPGRNVVPGLMSFVSELGYGSLPDLTKVNEQFNKEGNVLTPAFSYHKRLADEQMTMLKESGFSALYPDMEQFYLDQQKIHGAANKRMIEAVRSNPEIDGYCIHALVAGDWILGAGLLDIWRNPKTFAYEETKAANQPQIITIRTFPRNVYAEKGMTLEITGINELKSGEVSLQVEIVAESEEQVFIENVDLNWKSGISQLMQEKLETKNWGGDYTVKVTVLTQDKTVLTENSFGFSVFQESSLQAPKTKIAVFDTKNSLASFLKKSGVEVVVFSDNTNKSIPLFVGRKELTDQNSNIKLLDFMQNGGTAVFIEGVKETVENNATGFPFGVKVHPARGLWTCMPHLVHDHPIFKGLPSNTVMRELYENVWATATLLNIQPKGNEPFETIVGVVAFDWFSGDHKMHYSGPGESWWGSDVAIIPSEKGRCIVSQLRLVENLGKDPVADKLMYNIINYCAEQKMQ
jgi:hypothetical protein